MENDDSLKLEVKSIYEDIQEREVFIKHTNMNLTKEENTEHQRRSRALFITSIIVITFSYSLVWLTSPSVNMVIIISGGILAGYLLMLISTILDFLISKKDMSRLWKNPLTFLFDSCYLTLDHDDKFSQRLQQYSIRSLTIAKNRLSGQHTMVQTRFGFMVGPLNKLGLLPGIIAISITLFNQEYHQVTIHFAAILFAFYTVTYRVNFELPRIHFYTQMLEDEISMRTQS